MDKSVAISDGATRFVGRNEGLTTYSDPIGFRLVTTSAAPGDAGNYVVFTNRTDAAFALTFTYVSGSSGIAGLQIVNTAVDTDDDGLQDAWELRHFLNLDQGPTDNPDQDGSPNLAEQDRGTDPTDPDSDD